MTGGQRAASTPPQPSGRTERPPAPPKGRHAARVWVASYEPGYDRGHVIAVAAQPDAARAAAEDIAIMHTRAASAVYRARGALRSALIREALPQWGRPELADDDVDTEVEQLGTMEFYVAPFEVIGG